MGTPLRALVVGRSAGDARCVVNELGRGGYEPLIQRVEKETEFIGALDRQGWDVVFVHSALPHAGLARMVRLLRERDLDPPVIVISTRADEEEVVSAMKAGAHDCVSRANLGRLPGVVEEELRQAEARRSRREAERGRGEADDKYRNLTEGIPALTYVAWADEVGSRAFVGPQLRTMTGFSPAEWLADPEAWARQLHPDDRERVLSGYRQSMTTGEPFVSEYRVLTRDGRVAWWRDEGRVLRDAAGQPQFLRGLVVDITERKQAEDVIRRMTYHDALTGLPNRTLLLERLQHALARGNGDVQPLALLILDLDRFREINNTLGYHNGDRVIQEVARRLADVLGEPDRAARVRGDEFGILLPGADARLAKQVAHKVLKALESPFVVERLPLEVGASIGIAVAPDHGREPEILLRRADMAMQAAKRDEGRCVVFSGSCDPYSPERLAILGELRRALEADQLLLHYQPKVDLKSRHVVGTEALVRWRHPKRGLVLPDEFISLAENGGLIKPLTRWVLGEAVGQCHAWHQEGTNLPVAVNLSARNLQDPQLAEQIAELLETEHVEPESLELEITENAVMADPPRAIETLRSLVARGLSLALDDFGTGYSSMVNLRNLPVCEIKIDTSFVIGMAAHQEQDTAIVRCTNDLGHNLGLRVVAEGVEDRRTLDLLDSFGCDAAQGFYMAHPMPPSELAVWLKQSPWGVRPS